jgi:hypothetical protein
MAYTYERTISETANGVVDAGALKQEIVDASLSSATVQYVSTDAGTDSCDIEFDVEPSAGDKTTVNGILAAHEGVPDAGTLRVGGGIVVEDLDDPAAPTVAAQGTTGSTTWGYRVTAFSDTGETLASSETQITDGNATLSSTNHNLVSWSAVSGAVKYGVYRTTAGGTPSSTGLIRTTPELSYRDIGEAASGSVPSEDLSGGLVVGTGTVSSSKHTTLKELTSDQSTVTSLLRLARRTSGTAAAGFGTGVYVNLDDAGGTLRDAGSLHFRWDDPAAGTLHSKARIQLRDGGTSADKDFEINHNGKVTFDGATLIEPAICTAYFLPSAGIRGGNAGASSNNGVASITFSDLAESRIRWNFPPPRNYISGDVILRLKASVAANPASKDMYLEARWSTLNAGAALPSSPEFTDSTVFSTSGLGADDFFNIDLTLASADWDSSAEMIGMYLLRDGDNANDDCSELLHIHQIELRYTGWAFAGQAGQ